MPSVRADGERDDAGDEPHLQRDAQAVEDRRVEVAALRVGAEQMRVAVRADEARRAPRVGEAAGCARS